MEKAEKPQKIKKRNRLEKLNTVRKYLDFKNWPYKTPKEISAIIDEIIINWNKSRLYIPTEIKEKVESLIN